MTVAGAIDRYIGEIGAEAALRKNGVPEMALDGISPATLGAELTYLFGVLDHADIMWGVQLDMNALKRALRQLKKTRNVSRSGKRDRLVSSDELIRLTTYFYERWQKNAGTPMHLIMWFAIVSARRQGEIVRLALDDDMGDYFVVRDVKNPKGSKGNHKKFKIYDESRQLIELLKSVREKVLDLGYGATVSRSLIAILSRPLATATISEQLMLMADEPIPASSVLEVDKVQMGLHGVDWVIVGLGVSPTGAKYCDIKTHRPTNYTAPLLGREYHHGVLDCYAIVRDYYHRELNIELPDFQRADDWWEDENAEPLYQNNFEQAGFVQIDPKSDFSQLQRHDVILCRVGRTYHINHALIFIGDGKLQSETTPDCVGDCLVLHHPHGRLSVREIYGESWRKRTAMVVRHRLLAIKPNHD